MADNSKIEWTDATWTPVKGCTRVSPGCGGPGKAGGCYAEIMAARFSKPGQWGEGLAEIVTLPDGSKDHRWTGVVRFDEKELLKPLSWRTPRLIFVCSTADLFHEKVDDEWIDRVFAVMALCPQHSFQVLTKRPERMREYVSAPQRVARILGAMDGIWERCSGNFSAWPLPNVWLGTSTEDQQRADERIPHLLATPAAVRFISAEPLLGPIDLTKISTMAIRGCELVDAVNGQGMDFLGEPMRIIPRLDWVIVGGESGPGARPMHPDWARSLRDQCAAAGGPLFFKQWGEWAPGVNAKGPVLRTEQTADWINGRWDFSSITPKQAEELHFDDEPLLYRLGKKGAGRHLDGQLHDGMPA